jgi:ribosome-associated heat shock protein Hsp15
MSDAAVERMRLDKWLWCARFFKSRHLAAAFCTETGVRIAGAHVVKPHFGVKPGDVLTFALGPHVRTVRIKGLPARRGPAPEARACYDDLAPVDGHDRDHVIPRPR